MNRFLNLDKMAFTTYGSSMTITRKENAFMGFNMDNKVPDGYYFHPIYDSEMFHGLLFRLSFIGSESIEMQYEFKPEVLRLFLDWDSIRVCFPNRWTMRFCGCVRKGFRFTYENTRDGDVAFVINDQTAEVNIYTKKAMLHMRRGTLRMDAPWNSDLNRISHIVIDFLPDEEGCLDFSMTEFDRGFNYENDDRDFDVCVEAQRESYLSFKSTCIEAYNARYREAFDACAYLSWSTTMFRNGYIKDREIILLSKNWMGLTASWDNTFHLLVFGATNQKRAFDQLFGIMDYQEPTGAQPDWITSHRFNHSYLKPPVTGAVLMVLMDDGIQFETEYLKKTYDHVKKTVEFWLTYRDYDHDGIPEYGHGNDSGNDNCTVFDVAPNVEAPDLTAYIIANYDFFARCEEIFGNPEEARKWRQKADELCEKFMAHSYDRKLRKFVSHISGSHEVAQGGDALIDFMPLILVNHLDKDCINAMIAALKQENRFFTRWGFASESIGSAKYSRDSYWRGPIWAPQVFFIVEGLRMAGETEFAKEAAKRYVELCMHSGCFAENFDALNGVGLRDTSYSWGANVFQYFANKYCAE